MTYEQLANIADIINNNSATDYAVIPRVRKTHMQQVGTTLKQTSCFVLTIMVRGKTRNHVTRNFWKVYEHDMDKTIEKMRRKDEGLAQRYDESKLTVRDVEAIVRRSTYFSLKLKMVPYGLENLQ